MPQPVRWRVGRSIVVILEPRLSLGTAWRAALVAANYEVVDCADTTAALALMEARRPAAVVVGSSGTPECRGLETARRLHGGHPATPIILIATRSSEDHVLAALRAGVSDYLKPPLTARELLASVERCGARSEA